MDSSTIKGEKTPDLLMYVTLQAIHIY